MKPKTMRFAALLALGASFMAIFLYPHLPLKRTQLLLNASDTFLDPDASSDGQNGMAWINESEHYYRCFRGSHTTMYHCGYNTLFGNTPDVGVDLSGYQWIELSISYEGTAETLQVFLRHYDPRYSNREDHNSAKFISATVRARELQDVVRIGLHEFSVADWWLQQHNVPRQLSRPEFSNVVALGLDFYQEIPLGEHRFKVEKLEAVGAWIPEKDWYLGILILWMSTIFGLLSVHWVSAHYRAIQDRQRLRELVSENESLRTESDQFKQLSNIDHLTQVYNRRGFSKAAYDVASQSPDDIVLILLDIDHFKIINDKYGHDVGDKALRQVAELIVFNTRRSDVVGRWGGEEFTILCAHTDLEGGFALAEKIRKAIVSAVFQTNGKPTRITASFGVAMADRDKDFSDAFRRVDEALYQAKRNGRNLSVKAG